MDSVIKAAFWTDIRIEAAGPEIKLACLWLISNPARDLCGFTAVSNKRFEFETGLSASALEGASMGLASSIQKLPGDVWFMRNFLRHQFGKGGTLSLGNKVVIAATRHACKLAMPLRRAFFDAYPELLSIAECFAKNGLESEGASIPHAVKRDGVRVREGEGAREGEVVDQARALCILHPSRALTQPALNAARAAIKRHGFEAVRAGTVAYTAAVNGWTAAERLQFVTNPERFFSEDTWNQPAENWNSRTAARRENTPERQTVNVGGRKPKLNFDHLPKELQPKA